MVFLGARREALTRPCARTRLARSSRTGDEVRLRGEHVALRDRGVRGVPGRRRAARGLHTLQLHRQPRLRDPAPHHLHRRRPRGCACARAAYSSSALPPLTQVWPPRGHGGSSRSFSPWPVPRAQGPSAWISAWPSSWARRNATKKRTSSCALLARPLFILKRFLCWCVAMLILVAKGHDQPNRISDWTFYEMAAATHQPYRLLGEVHADSARCGLVSLQCAPGIVYSGSSQETRCRALRIFLNAEHT